MQKTVGARQLRELQRNASAGALLIRLFTPHVLEHGVEALGIGVPRRRRASRSERRIRWSLRLGACAVGLAAAGVLLARIAAHHAESDE